MIDLSEKIPERRIGAFAIERFEVSREASMLSAIRPGGYCPPGRYVRLLYGRHETVMSNTPQEKSLNYTPTHESVGHVLIAGLGLGMILPNVCGRKEVLSVTVVEREQEVIELVGGTVADPKLTILLGDIFSWEPPAGQKFDCIWFDIWHGWNSDFYEETKVLHARARKWRAKNPAGWVKSWARDLMRRGR